MDLCDALAALPDLVGRLLEPVGHEVYEQLAQTFFHYREFPVSGARHQLPDCARRAR